MDPKHIKALFDARNRAVEEMRALDSEFGDKPFDGEAETKYRKLNEDIDGLDERIQNGLADAERSAKADEARARFEDIARPEHEGRKSDEARNDDVEALRAMARGERRSVEFLPTPDEARALATGGGSGEGNLIETSLYSSVHEHLIEVSSLMRNAAQVIRTSGGNPIDFPRTSAFSQATIVGEAQPISESDPAWDKVTLGAYKYAFMVKLSSEMLDDQTFDLIGFLARQGGRALGTGMGAHFISGDGSGKPRGVSNATAGKVLAGQAVTADELLDVYHSVIEPYRGGAVWGLNDSTVLAVRKLKDANDQYIWQPGLQAGQPDRLLGKPVFTDPAFGELDDGLSTTVGAFGDLSGYLVRMAGALRIERSDDFAFDTDQVTFRFLQRADGDIVDTEGIRTIETAAA